MTREKSKAKTFDILHFVADNAGLSTFEVIEKAYNMGVSDQETILDKIRAEVERYNSYIDNPIYEGLPKPEGMKKAYANCLEIIDKYKAESEE